MPFPRFVARLNKRYTNRFIEPVVRLTPGFAVVSHQGRRSGNQYRTPVYAFRDGLGGVYVALTYGPSADWVQNVLANQATIERDGAAQTIATVAVADRNAAWPYLPWIVRTWLRVLRVRDFVHLTMHAN